MEVVSYARVSVSNGSDSLTAQHEAIAQYCQANGMTIAGTFEDDGISGTKGEDGRPGLSAALVSVKDGRRGLVVHRLDRLARQLHIQEAILTKVWAYGGKVFESIGGEVLEDDPTDPMRTFARHVCGAARQLERSMIVARMQGGRARCAAKGLHVGGIRPYGYQLEPNEPGKAPSLIPDDEELAVLAFIRDLRGSGSSLRAIGEELTRQGYGSPTGGKWHPSTISNLLKRP